MAGEFRGYSANNVDGHHYQTMASSVPIQQQNTALRVDGATQGNINVDHKLLLLLN